MDQHNMDQHNMTSLNMIQHEVRVSLPDHRSYPIWIGSGILANIGAYIKDWKLGPTVFLVTHPELVKWYANPVQANLIQQGFRVVLLTVPCGETSKSMTIVSTLVDSILSARPERADTVIGIGGGVIGDLAGFVAAIVLRGLQLIHIPTTLLAQVDSAIGGKTGVNHSTGKNLIGAFYQPRLTYIDSDTLKTLPALELKCGLAEVIKYGVIRDPDLFAYIETHADSIKRWSVSDFRDIWTSLIHHSCRNKAEVVSADERESGLRELLNFGHTIGHGIEGAAEYGTVPHGIAVSLGMRAAGFMAVQMGHWFSQDNDRLSRLLNVLEYPDHVTSVTPEDVYTTLQSDKKIKHGAIRFVLPRRIGHAQTVPCHDSELIRAAINTVVGPRSS